MAILDASKLNEEELKEVNGGYVYNTRNIRFDERGNGYCAWEVIDDTTGDVLQTVKSYGDAVRVCQERNLSVSELSWPQLDNLRKTGSPRG